jgi:hypothetical protein
MKSKLRQTIRKLLGQELGRNPLESFDQESERAAEGLLAWYIDNQEQLNGRSIAEALQSLSEEEDFVLPVSYSVRLLRGDARLVTIRERVMARRGADHPSAVQLAQAGDLASLRRLPASSLKLAMQSLKANEAAPLVTAWNLLPIYETQRLR